MAPGQTAGWATTERRWSAWRPPRVPATTRTSRSTASTPSATVARSTSSPRYPRLPAEATIARPSVVELQAQLTQLRERVGRYPEHLVDRLHTARSACAGRGRRRPVEDRRRTGANQLQVLPQSLRNWLR